MWRGFFFYFLVQLIDDRGFLFRVERNWVNSVVVEGGDQELSYISGGFLDGGHHLVR